MKGDFEKILYAWEVADDIATRRDGRSTMDDSFKAKALRQAMIEYVEKLELITDPIVDIHIRPDFEATAQDWMDFVDAKVKKMKAEAAAK